MGIGRAFCVYYFKTLIMILFVLFLFFTELGMAKLFILHSYNMVNFNVFQFRNEDRFSEKRDIKLQHV